MPEKSKKLLLSCMTEHFYFPKKASQTLHQRAQTHDGMAIRVSLLSKSHAKISAPLPVFAELEKTISSLRIEIKKKTFPPSWLTVQ